PASRTSPTWLPEDCQVGLSAGELRVGEHHDAVLGGFVETNHSGPLTEGVHPRDHFVLAQVLAGLVVRVRAPLPLGAAGIWAGGALLTRLSKSSWLCALALPTDTAPTVAADLAILGQARADVC
uniref:Uncharacterized protein n=1 Tax=Suricata suricatta TaxID=37032 RepID=A0A673SPD3_SURSU